MHPFFWVTALRAPSSSIDRIMLKLSFVVRLPPLSRYGGFVHKSITREIECARTSPEFNRLGPLRDDSVGVAIQEALNYHGKVVTVTRTAVAIQAVRNERRIIAVMTSRAATVQDVLDASEQPCMPW